MKKLVLVLLVATPAAADVTRTEVIDRAKAYVFYPWRATSANLTASCDGSYQSDYVAGDFVGVAYNWGGFDTLSQFTTKIGQGYAAGKPAGGAVLSCATGVDCSGFVSRTWKTTSKYGTATLPQISSTIAAANLLPGDIFNDENNHVTLFSHLLASGEPYMYEAAGPNARINAFGGWSWVDGYVPRRYQSITGTTATVTTGTFANPIDISAFPYTDSRDTKIAPGSVLDRCGAAPGTDESGPEYVYRVQLTSPGSLTASVADDVGVDVDIHLYTSENVGDCVARNDATITSQVDCGTYYLVVDTFGGAASAGNFDLMVSFTPSGQGCGSGPPSYDPQGQLGDPCAFPGNSNLASCNSTLGADVCIYTDGANPTSFCSNACTTDGDCTALGGCCSELSAGESYCLTAELCASDPGDPNDPGDPVDPTMPGDPSMPGDPPIEDEPKSGGCDAGGGQGWLLALGCALLATRTSSSRRRRA